MKTKEASLRRRLLFSTPAWSVRVPALALAGVASGALLLTSPRAACAYNFYNGQYQGKDLTIDLDTTVEYSNIYRVNDPSAILLNNVNGDEGDRDFRHGFVSNEFEATPIFDVKYGNYGVHVSGEFYLNTVYLQHNQNNSPGTFNPISTSDNTSFTSATRNNNGENAKLLDAFVYGSQYFGANNSQQVSLKFGRQTLLWGQSLLFASDGISAGQAPIDIQVAQGTPNALAQQVFLPVGQAVLTYQPNNWLTLQGYYQFEWEPDNFQGVGAYFSSADILDKGGQRLLLGSTNAGSALYRVKDNRPPVDDGQFGISAQVSQGNFDYGFFALRYDAKAPELYTGAPQPTQNSSPNNVGSYWLVYPRHIQLYGAAGSTTYGPVNIGVDFSYRRNAPLVSGAEQSLSFPGSANAGALYAVGQVLNFQISQIYVSPPLPLDPGGVSISAEEDINSVVAIDKNRAALTPDRQATAAAFQVIISPTYFFSALPNIQINFPVGLEAGLFNRSEFDSSENHGVGTVNCGVTAVYKQTWTAGLVYQDYLGAPNTSYNGLADRGYVGFNIEHTF